MNYRAISWNNLCSYLEMVGGRVTIHGNGNEEYKRTEMQATKNWELVLFWQRKLESNLSLLLHMNP